MRIALDAMGGDHAPGPIVAGALHAVAADAELRLRYLAFIASISFEPWNRHRRRRTC